MPRPFYSLTWCCVAFRCRTTFLQRDNAGGAISARRAAHSMYVYSPSQLSLHHLVLDVQADLVDAGQKWIG